MPRAEIAEADHNAYRAIRRDIHAHPELAFQEVRTAGIVAERLKAMGLAVHEGMARTGVVGVLKKGSSNRSIGIRADMDALPMPEHNAFAHRSVHPGVMHACGHDGHTAILLGAADYISRHGDFDGTVNFIFQPAEEGGNAGAKAMMDAGLFTSFPCDAVFGLHNWPGIEEGKFAFRAGPQMASCNDFKLTVTGRGAHAAQPQAGADPVLAAAHVITALQAIIARNTHPFQSAVLSVTQMQGGTVTNIIPGEAWIGGTVRTFDAALLDKIEQRMGEVAAATAQAFECQASLVFKRILPALVNTQAETDFVAQVLRRTFGDAMVDAQVEPTMGGEDFAFMLQERPGCYVLLGNGSGESRDAGHGLGPCALHNGSYDFNDALIGVGIRYWDALVKAWLGKE